MTIVLQDNFNRSDGASIGTATTGQIWTTNGTQGIRSSKAFVSADYGGIGINTGLNNYFVQVTFVTISIGNEPSLVFKRIDDTTHVGVMAISGAYVIRGFNFDEGWFTYSSYSCTPTNGDIIKVVCNAGVATVYLNGSLIITWTINSHYLPTTYVGLHSLSTVNEFDNFIVDDLVAGGNAYTKTLSDTVTGSETIAKAAGKRENDTISVTETLIKNRSIIIVDTANIGDSANKLTGKNVNLSDALAISDTIRKTLSKFQNDTITGSDNENKAANRRLNDSVTAADTITSFNGKLITLTDALSLSDGIRKSLSKFQTDTVTGSDGEQKAANRQINDALAASDIIATFKGKTVILTDSLSFTDTLRKSIVKSKLETLGITENAAAKSNINIKLFDVVVLSDSINLFLPNKLIYKQLIQGDLIINRLLNGDTIITRKSSGETLIITKIEGELFL